MSVKDILFDSSKFDMQSVSIVRRGLNTDSELQQPLCTNGELLTSQTFTLDIQSILFGGVKCKMLVCRDITMLTQNTRLQE